MKRKKFSVLLSLMFICILLCGCSGSSRITGNELYVESIGIDLEDGLFSCTVQIFDPVSGAYTLQEQEDAITKVIEVSGDTVPSALAQLPGRLSRRVFYSQNKVIVLGSSAADRLWQAIDSFTDDWESSLNTRLLLSQGKAADIINASFGGAVNPSERLRQAADSGKSGGGAISSTLLDAVKANADETTGLAIPIMSLENKGEDSEHLRCTGAQLYKGTDLVGSADQIQTQMLLMLLNNTRGSSVSLETACGIAELKRVRTDIEVTAEQGNDDAYALCHLDIHAQSNRLEQGESVGIDKAVKDEIEKIAVETAEKVTDCGCDLLRIQQRLNYKGLSQKLPVLFECSVDIKH